MIGGRRPIAGPETRGPARPRRAPARAVLPLHGPGPAGRQGRRPTRRRRRSAGSWARIRAGRVRAPARERGGDRRAAVEEEGARDLQLRRDQLVGLRDRGDPAGPHPRRRRRRSPVLAPGRDRDLDPARGRRAVVPPGLPGLSVRRRRLRGLEGEPRRPGQPGRGRGPPDRLRDDGRGVDGVGRRPDLLGRPGPVRLPDRDRASSRSR